MTNTDEHVGYVEGGEVRKAADCISREATAAAVEKTRVADGAGISDLLKFIAAAIRDDRVTPPARPASPAPASLPLLDDLDALLAKATKGVWVLQDGCSWRRIGTHFHDGDVLCPTNARSDGHPDLIAADGKLYDNLKLIVALVNAAPQLLALARKQVGEEG